MLGHVFKTPSCQLPVEGLRDQLWTDIHGIGESPQPTYKPPVSFQPVEDGSRRERCVWGCEAGWDLKSAGTRRCRVLHGIGGHTVCPSRVDLRFRGSKPLQNVLGAKLNLARRKGLVPPPRGWYLEAKLAPELSSGPLYHCPPRTTLRTSLWEVAALG